MGATAAAVAYINAPTLADQVSRYKRKYNVNNVTLAQEINYSRSTVSRYLAGKYDSDPTELEAKLSAWLAKKTGTEFERQEKPPLIRRRGFYESRDAVKMIGLCAACHEERGLGLIAGRSGFGKTESLKRYAKMERVTYIKCDVSMGCRDLVECIERATGLPTSRATTWKRVDRIRDFYKVNKGYLLIVDEADKLISANTTKKLEVLRDIFDEGDVGIVIAGEPMLEAVVRTYLPRFADRVDLRYRPEGLTSKEVEDILSDYEVDVDAMAEFKARAGAKDGGSFRRFDRTLKNVLRVLEAEGEARITLQVIHQASEMMVL